MWRTWRQSLTAAAAAAAAATADAAAPWSTRLPPSVKEVTCGRPAPQCVIASDGSVDRMHPPILRPSSSLALCTSVVGAFHICGCSATVVTQQSQRHRHPQWHQPAAASAVAATMAAAAAARSRVAVNVIAFEQTQRC
jgi:hypothetical protein